MACTVAVEASITDHYNSQIRQLVKDDPEGNKELIDTITKCEKCAIIHRTVERTSPKT